ncbi:MAG: hypothetical protein AAFW75_00210 [Cyanobacteria bacterium J06636_16]
MKFHLITIISLLCLSASLLGVFAGVRAVGQDSSDTGVVASEYNPPGRGARYPGGTRNSEQPIHRTDV